MGTLVGQGVGGTCSSDDNVPCILECMCINRILT